MEMYEAKIKSWEDSIPTNLDKIDNAKKQTETFLESMRDILHHEQTRLNGSFHETVENIYRKSERKVKSALDLLSYKIEEYSESQNRREKVLELLRSSFQQEQEQFKQEQIRLNDSVQKTVENMYLQSESKVKSVTDSLSINRIIEEFENKSENALDLRQSSFLKEQDRFKQMKIGLNDSFKETVDNIYRQSEVKVKSVLDSLSTKLGEYEKRSENALEVLHSTLLQEQQRLNDSLQATVENIQTETESKVKNILESISFKMNQFSESHSKREDALELLQSNFLQQQERSNHSFHLMTNDIKEELNKTIKSFISELSECEDITDAKSGIYTISPLNLNTYKLRCEDGNWTVIQKRFNGTTEFYRNWEDYENGFGDLNGEFWLGNKMIALLTSIGTHELRINLEDWDENKRYANFKNFKIDGASDKYRLHISGYSGDAGDGMTEYNGYYFSTYDRDHDTYSSINCAADGIIKGAWWLYNCWSGSGASLNGKYTSGPSNFAGIRYKAWKYQSLKKSTMMIRKV
ncbi:fibrinogen gamma-B chain-like [Mytilus edulis]|uniref:fibrinogen gamma-B chain-like n=1 Tax=Mytilus edulis TaxID=6550 RepID=UPI0039EFC828